MRVTSTRRTLGLLLLAALIGIGSACRRPSSDAQPQAAAAAPRPNAYVDPSTCADCHQEAARTFRLTGMGRSVTNLTPNELRLAAPVRLHHEASQRYYTITQRDGIIYQRRTKLVLGA